MTKQELRWRREERAEEDQRLADAGSHPDNCLCKAVKQEIAVGEACCYQGRNIFKG